VKKGFTPQEEVLRVDPAMITQLRHEGSNKNDK